METKSYSEATDEELIAYCRSPEAVYLGGTEEYSTKVVRFEQDAVIEFGHSITKSQVDNMKIVKGLVDPQILYVPTVYRFFTDPNDKGYYSKNECGYLVMEFVQGASVEPLEDPVLVQKVSDWLPLPRNVQVHEIMFDSLQALETFFRSRLRRRNPPLAFDPGVKLVLCHLDMAPRNLIWRDDGTLCAIDWASAGYFPRVFEFAAVRYQEGMEGGFTRLLLERMQPALTEEEEVQCRAIMSARWNCEKYAFVTPEEKEERRKARDAPNPVLKYPGHGDSQE
ncbi:hypothetical protein AJ79_01561 [Helicocarpus griseus UAMH5409]|uniref:Aminoglycoside phosphotransferase domain-containing protein n=1 Tax=Helicocarpus griseus UAMH5409 TaxID=1447875 RepID=A0A2B7Y6F3_9EURO|nr:hypothetical protein AJ79_01561 [Helicocarpus griseus UAMH5409]